MVKTTHHSADLAPWTSRLKPVLATLSGAVGHPLQTCRLLHLVNTHPALSALPGIRIRMLSKVYRPYLSAAFDGAARIALLQRHYDIVQKAGFGKLVQQAAVRRLILCTFIGKSGERYRLELSSVGDHRRAGEWVLRLVSRDICVYTVTFLFGGERNERHVLVGSLTGMLSPGHRAQQRISVMQATWDLHGWQPRQMMISLVQEIGACLGCDKAVLVGNRNKLADTDTRFCRRTADYDRVWKLLNASARDDGNYELPCPATSPDSCTRSALHARTKRSALIESIHHALRMRLADERSWPATVVQLQQFDELKRKSA